MTTFASRSTSASNCCSVSCWVELQMFTPNHFMIALVLVLFSSSPSNPSPQRETITAVTLSLSSHWLKYTYQGIILSKMGCLNFIGHFLSSHTSSLYAFSFFLISSHADFISFLIPCAVFISSCLASISAFCTICSYTGCVALMSAFISSFIALVLFSFPLSRSHFLLHFHFHSHPGLVSSFQISLASIVL